jgi:hypothetical protein
MPLSSLLSICPNISNRDGKLTAVSSWRFLLLTLGCLYRKVTVDSQRKEILIERRYGWFFPKAYRLNFSEIEAVTYGYEDLLSFNSFATGAHDGFDIFSVGLRFKNDEEWKLFNFFGEGTFSNDSPWPDWFYLDEFLFDESGTQEKESRIFVELLSRLMSVPVVPPRP